jgi:putative two-component system hydrogenase maturation factor HypX/HoxX
MRVLLLTDGFNSLAQRLFVALADAGHVVSVEYDIDDRVTEEAVALFRPDLVIAPYLRRAIPEAIWRRHVCLVVHPGIEGDRGPSALDWAILEGEADWGITLLQANAEMDAGPVWETRTFAMRPAAKSSLYRNEVADAAEAAVLSAVGRIARGLNRPVPRDDRRAVRGRPRPPMRQSDRAIDWRADPTDLVLRKIRSGDGRPGVRDRILGLPVWLYDAHPEPGLAVGRPGEVVGRGDEAVVVGQDHEAIVVGTVDGAVRIGHLRERGDTGGGLKLPAVQVLGGRLNGVPSLPAGDGSWRDIRYEERGRVGFLHFAFYNGAMSTARCRRLRAAYAATRARPTAVIVLLGGPDFWSNGMHLNAIEAAASPADESWANINAIDDFVLDVLTTTDHWTIAALQGNAGAGGVFMALACDEVLMRRGVVLNPHYKNMGNLYGSEYWTYLLPRRTGEDRAAAIAAARLPMGCAEAERLGLIDRSLAGPVDVFRAEVARHALALADDPGLPHRLAEKRRSRAADEAAKPLARYREEELERMRLNFWGFDPSYHVARSNFVRAVPKSRTPPVIARHRRRGARADA